MNDSVRYYTDEVIDILLILKKLHKEEPFKCWRRIPMSAGYLNLYHDILDETWKSYCSKFEEKYGMEIKEEFDKLGIVDNPFEVMLYQSLELARDCLFATVRLGDPDVPDTIQPSKTNIQFRMNKIIEAFDQVSRLSKEASALCRETSYYYNNNNEFKRVNTRLLTFEKKLETEYNKNKPYRDDRYERIRLGADSEEYKRMMNLKYIIDHSDELSAVTEDFLSNLVDVLNRPDECIKAGWNTEEEIKIKQDIIKKFELTESDILYMIAYIRNKKQMKKG